MVWHVWHGMAWCGMAWHGIVWHGIVWHGIVWHGIVWHGMVCHGMVRVVWYFKLRNVKQVKAKSIYWCTSKIILFNFYAETLKN